MPSPGSRRGLVSCLHSKCDDARSSGFNGKGVTELLHDLLADIYAEAFDRLPFEGLPAKDAEKLLTAMCTGGVCVGLLDPVSNIILNTISVLPSDFPSDQPPPRRSKRLAIDYTSSSARKSKRRAGPAQTEHVWSYISRLSCHALVRFLVRYFGCLTSDQAARYLRWAHADLTLAVLLVEHDLYAAADEPQLLDPASERTQAALKCAATTGRHPAPDVLVRLHTSPLPQQRILAAAPFLKPGGRSLTLQDVHTVIDSLRCQESASLDLQVNLLPDGRGVVVYCRDFNAKEGKLIRDTSSSVDNNGGRFNVFTFMVERHGDSFASLRDKKSMLSTFLEKVEKTSQAGSRLKTCGDACEYTESLKMRLHGTLHTLYLKAFTMLPSNVSRRLIRYILFAGHCYGPMDPVSNIIINSIWHSIVFPLPSANSESEVAYDILETLAMLRVEARSLRGLIALVKASSDCSTQQAMEHLCSNRCHLSEEMHTANGFATAAEAAQHPQHAALGSFLSSLTPHVLDNLRPLLSTSNGGTVSSESLDQVERILTKEIRETALLFAAEEAELCKAAKDTLLIKRSAYNKFRLFIRTELAKVLQKYASEHPQEPKYVPSVICGVIDTHYSERDSYHVNFVTASESAGADNQLFFAEINAPCHQSKPNFCSRICLTHTGRCYYGQSSAIKIVYPASSDYFECDITCGGIKQANMMLNADYLRF